MYRYYNLEKLNDSRYGKLIVTFADTCIIAF